ncbi:hypothetical protein WMY93_012915 [Mugilogobius chulae]|uniref:Interleukin 17C n=1 Tax=Mugilogobius chulae TaxID=88201 RepID=A0AAW0P4K6_9GOBI
MGSGIHSDITVLIIQLRTILQSSQTTDGKTSSKRHTIRKYPSKEANLLRFCSRHRHINTDSESDDERDVMRFPREWCESGHVKMSSRALQVLVLGACTVMAAARCLDARQLQVRADRFQARHPMRAFPRTQLPELTCAQLIEHAPLQSRLHMRALSPWTYRVNRDERRFPRDILEAHCLCSGCILQGAHQDRPHEEHDYNSVPVYAHVPVLNKNRCAGRTDKYRLTKSRLRVPVACVCAAPNRTTSTD